MSAAGLAEVAAEVVACRRCARLVAWREEVAARPRAAYAGERYWGRPLPGFGDPDAEILILGLAPAAHGANRTGRLFTGDRSGDFLFAAMHRCGLSNQPAATAPDDGLRLSRCFITAAVRCAPPDNRPTPSERDRCLPFAIRELAQLERIAVIVCLGGFAWNAALRLRAAAGEARISPVPRFGHGTELGGLRLALIGSFHPSQQNTFTGRLTQPMLDAVLRRACQLADRVDPPRTVP